jgi:leader peptidase (prepilin peptidase) / N-methyltransferase
VFLFFIFILGLFVGSFLNVLSDRIPRGETVVKGRSHCEKCKKELIWYDLIPLLSFIFLGGKCRYCQTRLSLFYPAVELVTGISLATATFFVLGNFQFSIYNLQPIFNFQFTISLIYYLFIVSCLIVVFFADMKYGMIPDKIIFPAIIISGLYLFIIQNSLFVNHLFSAFGTCLFFFLLSLIKIRKQTAMGFGDVKFAFLMGLVLGYPNIIVGLYAAFLTGAIIGCILIVWRKKKLKGASIPFGPFLVLGTILAMFWGDLIFQKIISALL